ncbi:hypothetical protein Acr_17g0007280 [Actinidia rufa]|uniref:Uncharacterized protein n=1 Tax=Actinidia rufa TaxID=165716 RepID=A0A7J0G2Z3_9ERIC|nr:hypothetical protein Acr_17g0007280 [Actinidia rufa]
MYISQSIFLRSCIAPNLPGTITDPPSIPTFALRTFVQQLLPLSILLANTAGLMLNSSSPYLDTPLYFASYVVRHPDMFLACYICREHLSISIQVDADWMVNANVALTRRACGAWRMDWILPGMWTRVLAHGSLPLAHARVCWHHLPCGNTWTLLPAEVKEEWGNHVRIRLRLLGGVIVFSSKGVEIYWVCPSHCNFWMFFFHSRSAGLVYYGDGLLMGILPLWLYACFNPFVGVRVIYSGRVGCFQRVVLLPSCWLSSSMWSSSCGAATYAGWTDDLAASCVVGSSLGHVLLYLDGLVLPNRF